MTTPTISEELEKLVQAATTLDGQHPFSDQSVVELARGDRRLIEVRDEGGPDHIDASLIGAAVVGTALDGTAEFELVITPDSRGRGHGAALTADVLQQFPAATFAWAHGDHPASRSLAARFGFTAVRTLLQLHAPVPADRPVDAYDGQVSAFRPGVDDAAWLVLNARAFADHEEQGSLTQRDLDDRIAQPWFAPEDFLLLRDDDDRLVAFCWMKVDDGVGEFYAVGVDPSLHGRGLGRVLMRAGFARLAERGILVSALYVEADNAPALALYRKFGFTQHTIDVRYRKER